jgi:aminoglycoside 6'-N-acetyltransferase
MRTSDLAAFQAYRSIPELGRFQGWSPLSETEALSFLGEMSEARLFTAGNWVQLGIADHADGHLIGDIGVFVSADGLTGEIGFTLAPAAQGRGIAAAAVREVLQLLFDVTGVMRVLGVTDRRNGRSIRVLERVGFRHCESRSAVFRGEPCVEDVYAIARDDG